MNAAPTVPLPGRKATLGGIVIFFMAYFIYHVYGDGADLTMNHWITIWACVGIMLLVFILYTWVNYKQKQILPVEMSFNAEPIQRVTRMIDNLKVLAEAADEKADRALARDEEKK